MPAATITQTVLAKFVAATLTDFDASLGLWLGEIPEDLSLPVIGFVHGGERPEYTFEREYIDTGSFTFTIFAETVRQEAPRRWGLRDVVLFDPGVRIGTTEEERQKVAGFVRDIDCAIVGLGT